MLRNNRALQHVAAFEHSEYLYNFAERPPRIDDRAEPPAAAGQQFSATPTGARDVVEDDVVSFTPSGANGSSIGGQMYAVFKKA